MKLRYYLRGLGIGIIGTALIMQLTAGSTGNMTDEEVKKRAAELGMVEESATTLLKESEKRMEERKETESQKQISSNEVSENKVSENEISEEVSDNEVSANLASQNETPALPLGTVLDEAEDGQASGQKQQEKAEPKEQEQKEPEKKEQEEPVTITISSGQGSLSVAKSCESAGLVTDAAEFDRFLCAGGYDRRLKAGSHQIKKGASKEEIAEALCRRN